jgi:hypothetical protein
MISISSLFFLKCIYRAAEPPRLSAEAEPRH